MPGVESGVGLSWQPRVLAYAVCRGGVGPRNSPEAWCVPVEADRASQILSRAGPPPTRVEATAVAMYSKIGVTLTMHAGSPRHSSAERTLRNYALGAVGASARDKAASGHAVNAGPRKHGRALAAHIYNNLGGLGAVQKGADPPAVITTPGAALTEWRIGSASGSGDSRRLWRTHGRGAPHLSWRRARRDRLPLSAMMR